MLDPRVVRFQEIKRAAKEKAIKKVAAARIIMNANPGMTEREAIKAHEAQEDEKARVKSIVIRGKQVIIQRLLSDLKKQYGVG